MAVFEPIPDRELIQLDDSQVVRRAPIDGKVKRQLHIFRLRVVKGNSMTIGLSAPCGDLPLSSFIHTWSIWI